ncbi:FtsX-like permease family protein [Arsenicicoccus sp. oral taxon 190]|uniref:FtsX-like permease family protein n=1 Tax=Arsenicicoccus sp. oral taxon 190 TaxID=1658671 RepID=UPI00067A0569|nr:FtsX-like permease family protein [Arsenicicoccus sp. oral taxon 190]AKT51116.1 hypothetical protein ADJ73_06920 [Arsenicicoccus sp. oral taxon 190]
MTTSISLALATLRGQARRLVSVLLAIGLGVAFVAATLATGDTFRASLTRDAAGSVGQAAAVVTTSRDTHGSGPATIPAGLPDAIRSAQPGATVRTVVTGGVMQDLGGRQGHLVLQTTPALSGTTTLVAGRLPAAPGEIALTESTAESRHLTVGQVTRLLPAGSGSTAAQGDRATVSARVVGVVRAGRDAVPSPGLPTGFAADRDIWAWTGQQGYRTAYVDTPASPTAVRDRVAALPAAHGLVVRTGEQEKQARVDELTQGSQILTGMLLVFAVVAVFVSALVIANTFAILVAQRTRQLALLRCVGADRSQVRGSVVAEALLVGVVGALAGTALGLALAAGLVRLSQGTTLDLGHLVVTPPAVVVPLLTGIVVTVVAALAPARAATRVAPLAALRPTAVTRVRRVTRVRLVVGSLLTAGGLALLVLGAQRHEMLLGVPGGLLSFLGVLAVGPVVIPALARAVGAVPARLGGVPATLAVENSRRNPARAAATAGALLVGVTLITMMSVGSATGTRSATEALDKKMPVDALVSAPRGLSGGDLQTVRRSGVVQAASLVSTTEATLQAGTTSSRSTVTGAGQDAAAVSRRQQLLTGLDDHTVLLPPTPGVRTGDPVTLTHGSRHVELRADVSADHAEAPVVTAATLTRLDPQARATAWVRLADGKDVGAAAEQLATDTAGIQGAQVEGVGIQRAEMERVMDIVLLVVTGLLGVAVLIALVGIGNTLSLSVLERTQESGLLRALGLTRGQLRTMLGLEALTLAAVGTLVGLLLGVGYGIGGAHALFGGEMPIVAEIPWARLGLVAAVALGAGWLASVIPARRASRVSPAAALATD